MFALRRKKSRKPTRADPAPSRWAWRMQRLMLTPAFLFGLRVGTPFCATLLAGTVYLSDPDRRDAITRAVAETRASIEERPEFMVKLMAVDGASGGLAEDIRTAVPLEFPLSSFDLDLSSIRADVTAINGVKSANVRIRPGGILQIDVTPRVPAAIWRNENGLALVDATGAHVTTIAARAEYPDLPLIAGEGAARHVAEALQLYQTGSVLGARLKGVVRMGDRRWDLVLDRDQRILLPEAGAMQALERVIALDNAEEVLSRDISRVDLRLADRPTIRMTQYATQTWWEIKHGTAE